MGGLGPCRAALKSLSRGPLGTILLARSANKMVGATGIEPVTPPV
jgi:hypothetical protein